jgi:hypothetical protein
MGDRYMRVRGADDYAINSNGTNYLPNVQVSTVASWLYRLTLYGISTLTPPVYLCVYDTAAGSAASTTPKYVYKLTASTYQEIQFNNGVFFKNGIFLCLNTVEPVLPTTAATYAANNSAIVAADFSLG